MKNRTEKRNIIDVTYSVCQLLITMHRFTAIIIHIWTFINAFSTKFSTSLQYSRSIYSEYCSDPEYHRRTSVVVTITQIWHCFMLFVCARERKIGTYYQTLARRGHQFKAWKKKHTRELWDQSQHSYISEYHHCYNIANASICIRPIFHDQQKGAPHRPKFPMVRITLSPHIFYPIQLLAMNLVA